MPEEVLTAKQVADELKINITRVYVKGPVEGHVHHLNLLA